MIFFSFFNRSVNIGDKTFLLLKCWVYGIKNSVIQSLFQSHTQSSFLHYKLRLNDEKDKMLRKKANFENTSKSCKIFTK